MGEESRARVARNGPFGGEDQSPPSPRGLVYSGESYAARRAASHTAGATRGRVSLASLRKRGLASRHGTGSCVPSSSGRGDRDTREPITAAQAIAQNIRRGSWGQENSYRDDVGIDIILVEYVLHQTERGVVIGAFRSSAAELTSRREELGRVDSEAARRVAVGVIQELDRLVIDDVLADLCPLPDPAPSAVEPRIVYRTSSNAVDRCAGRIVKDSVSAESQDNGSFYGAGSDNCAGPNTLHFSTTLHLPPGAASALSIGIATRIPVSARTASPAFVYMGFSFFDCTVRCYLLHQDQCEVVALLARGAARRIRKTRSRH